MNTLNPASGNDTGLPTPDLTAATAALTILDTQDALQKARDMVELVRAAASGEADKEAIATGAWIACEMLDTVAENLKEIAPFIVATRDGEAP